MGHRIDTGTTRPAMINFRFDGASISAFPGETVAAALIASSIRRLRVDLHGRPRGPYCNMGSCFECLIEVKTDEGQPESPSETAVESWRTARACLTAVTPDLVARSRSLSAETKGSGG